MTLSIRAVALLSAGLGAIAVGTLSFARGGGHAAPPAVYRLDPAAPPDEPMVQTTATPAKRVSVRFNNAPARQVLDWLSKQDANFVIETSSIPSSVRLTLNVKDEPLSSVERVIANALGGSWVKHDGILVFQKGLMTGEPMVLGDGFMGDGKRFKSLPGGDGQFWASPDGKELQLHLKDLDKLGDQFGPEWQKKFEKDFGPEFQKKIQDQFGPEFEKKIQDQFGPEWQKRIEKEFGPDFQKKMQDQFGPEFQKRIQDEIKNGKGQGWVFSDGNGGRVFSLGHQDFNGILESLTGDQKALMKKRGYLTPKDLNEKQRKLLGEVSGKFELKVKTDKGEMTIKSE
ncbi:MAG TPA: hypothetical protein VKT78_06505 [Fimbriimonadaceae bacterium]|nr:hypothetical protein [Fimbriimonadaceae bacterium]